MLSVNERSLEYRGMRADCESVRLTTGGSQAKSCDDVCPKVVRERSKVDRGQSPAMMFAQGWFANEARWIAGEVLR